METSMMSVASNIRTTLSSEKKCSKVLLGKALNTVPFSSWLELLTTHGNLTCIS